MSSVRASDESATGTPPVKIGEMKLEVVVVRLIRLVQRSGRQWLAAPRGERAGARTVTETIDEKG